MRPDAVFAAIFAFVHPRGETPPDQPGPADPDALRDDSDRPAFLAAGDAEIAVALNPTAGAANAGSR
jgi:hypothetical protein